MNVSSKTLYDEAIADVKKMKEIAESQARDLVLKKVEPRIKELVEQQLFGESDEECDEASGVGSIQGSMSSHEEEDNLDESDEEEAESQEETQYEVTEGCESSLSNLASFARPMNDDRFVAEVYKLHESVRQHVTTDKQTQLSDNFVVSVDETISKLEDMYAYLKESYVGDDADKLEQNLEKSYGLINAVKESTMKMRDLLNEEVLTLKLNGLPDGVDLDGLTVDVVSDDEVEADASAEAPAADASAPAPEAAEAAPPAPQAESDDADDDDMIEISESELRAELARLGSLDEGDGVEDYGDGSSEGHPVKDSVSDLESLKVENARRRLTRSAKRLSESRGTPREEFARAMYNSAIASYRKARSASVLSEKKSSASSKAVFEESRQAALASKKVSAPAVKNTADSKRLAEAESKVTKLTAQLVEANLLNAKLIHANKLLRLEGLTKAQQAMVIDRLDEAKNLREVRLISESLSKVLAGSKDSLVESASRRPSGSASRPSSSGAVSKNLNEGLETARWAELAGIK